MICVADIGGTRMRAAVGDPLTGELFGKPVIEPTPERYEDGVAQIAELLCAAASDATDADHPIERIVLGVPGVVDRDHGGLARSPHLKDWEDRLFAADLGKALAGRPEGELFAGAAIHLINDASLVALGEAAFGAGRQYGIVSYVTVSTGIGGARIVNGRIDPTHYGFEPGFQIIDVTTSATLEELASGTAVERTFGDHPKKVAQTGAWAEVERILAIGLHNCVVHWSPDVLVVGGSMANDLDAKRLTTLMEHHPKAHPKLPKIVLAELDAFGGLYGGLAFARTLATDAAEKAGKSEEGEDEAL